MKEVKILFVCSANCNRSPAFEREFKRMYERKFHPLVTPIKFEIRSAGCYYGYPHQVDEEILKWADIIFVMDISHKLFIHKKYHEYLDKVKIVGVSDQYDVDDYELKTIIQYWHDTEFLKWLSLNVNSADIGLLTKG